MSYTTDVLLKEIKELEHRNRWLEAHITEQSQYPLTDKYGLNGETRGQLIEGLKVSLEINREHINEIKAALEKLKPANEPYTRTTIS